MTSSHDCDSLKSLKTIKLHHNIQNKLNSKLKEGEIQQASGF